MPPVWFGLQLWMTQVHELDAVIINYAGKLRYHMQNIGLVYSMHNLEASRVSLDYHAHPGTDSFDTMESVIGSLLGIVEVDEVPEALDPGVKESLREFNETLSKIKSVQQAVPSMTLPELKKTVADINAATLSIDHIVHAASEGANRRVRELLVVNIFRALVQFLYACVTMSIVGNIWAHYYAAYMKLDSVQKRQMTMLNTMFDVVVPISIGDDFVVLQSHSKLDHLLGRNMQGINILSCAIDLDAREELQKLLRFAAHSLNSDKVDQRSQCVSSWVRQSWWWNLVPCVCNEEFPVAPMIRTTLCRASVGAPGLPKDVQLEAIATPYYSVTGNSGTLLLGLRVITHPDTPLEINLAFDPFEAERIQDTAEIEAVAASASEERQPSAAAAADLAATAAGSAAALSSMLQAAAAAVPASLHGSRMPEVADTRLPPQILRGDSSIDTGSGVDFAGRGSRSGRSGRSSGDTTIERAISQYSGSDTTPPPTLYGQTMPHAGTGRLTAMAAAQNSLSFAGQVSERLGDLPRQASL